ncbi:hypothetical protein CHGG_10825 [Chaetomium globosum CBS 148.51]|uniref:HTH psq-type domain-containing protein n=1 Tax=Chaetomium globosum (strain ATCC 6205 / CBS 148.51 / DSM 1962 / NBRC 6347 / NRRL 1970) TaxID=306901 RepID=Q2GMH9_CHAGB|nr:uncharacterized protein CHGG_10825 [Chaetomium globosum CBS 148.51]EAQ83007.1 hypothetical protein CHGG_10825 [Chaetomium globosum CBS 148.51]
MHCSPRRISSSLFHQILPQPALRSPPKEARLRMAVEAIGKNKSLNIRAAARLYNVPEATIRHRRTGPSPRRDLPANSHMANHLLRERDAPPVGKLWAHNFVKRQPQLRTRRTRRYDYQRAKCEDPKVIGEWFTLVQNTRAKYGIVDDDVYNFDETGFMMGIIFAGMVVTTSDGRSKAKLAQPGNREWATVTQDRHTVA